MICKYAIRETVNEVNLTGKDGNVTQLNQSLVTKVPLESCKWELFFNLVRIHK